MKLFKRSVAILMSVLLIFTGLSFSSLAATSATVLTGSSTGKTLNSGYYVVTSNTNCYNTSAGGNGINISSGATVVIEIRSGVTLYASGCNGSGTTRGGAGIYLPSNATLILVGEGTLSAQGGSSGYSSAGGTGGSAWLNTSSEQFQGGAGGTGGYGAGGAGAGIGGYGGNGGSGGSGGYCSVYSCSYGNDYMGSSGYSGVSGSAGASMGTLYVLGRITVSAAGGAAASGSAGGSGGGYDDDAGSGWSNDYATGGGGGGGGGGSTYAAAAIGGGTGGAGGGGGGGAGGVFTSADEHSYPYGYGGTGADGGSSGSQGQRGNTSNRCWNYLSHTYGGSAGSRGSTGSAGTVYKASTANSTRYDYSSTYTVNSAVISLVGNGGSTGTVSYSYNGNSKYDFTASSRTGYTCTGYFTAASGGTKLLDANGNIAVSSYTNYIYNSRWNTCSNTTLYAQWTPNVYTVTLDNQSADTAGTTAVYEKYNTGYYANSECTTALGTITLPTRSGYTFGGYYTGTNGTGTQCLTPSGERVPSALTVTSYTANVSVYAYWIKNYSVSLPSSSTYTVTQTSSLDPAAVASGSIFTFTVAPNTGYSQRTPVVKANGSVIAAVDGVYTLSVDRNYTITCDDLAINRYVITYPATQENYTISEYAENAAYGETVSFRLAVDAAYSMTTPVVKANGIRLTPVGDLYTISNVSENIDITVDPVDSINKYTVKFVDYNNAVLDSQSVDYGSDATIISEPIRADETIGSSTVSYSFVGWFDEQTGGTQVTDFSNITADKTVYAHYREGKFVFVTFYNQNGSSILKREAVEINSTVSFTGTAPTKVSTAQYNYTFTGWSLDANDTAKDYNVNAVIEVTDTLNLYATFRPELRSYNVSFIDGDGDECSSKVVAYGSYADYSGTVPVKTGDAQYSYAFTGWDSNPSSTPITGTTTFTAQFNAVVNRYTVYFYADETENTLLKYYTVDYGSAVAYTGDVPVKESTIGNDYVFTGWDMDTGNITGELKVHAQFDSVLRGYTVNFYNGSELLYTQNVQYGAAAVYSGSTPTRSSTAEYCYEFIDWDADYSNINGNLDVFAVFTALNHTPNDIYTAPTCTQEGNVTSICSHCNRVLSVTAVEATGHDYSAWETVTAATHTTEGVKKHVCSKCFETETARINTTGEHTYVAAVTVPATCNTDGVMTYSCACGDYYTEIINHTGHTFQDRTVVTPATCETAGVEEALCQSCGIHYMRDIPAMGHSVTDGTDNEDGTCTGVCDSCGKTVTVKIAADDPTDDPSDDPSVEDDNDVTEFMRWWNNFWKWLKELIVNFKDVLGLIQN